MAGHHCIGKDWRVALSVGTSKPAMDGREPPIKRLLLRGQRSILALLEGHLAVGMILGNALITAVHIHLHIRTHRTARAGLVWSSSWAVWRISNILLL